MANSVHSFLLLFLDKALLRPLKKIFLFQDIILMLNCFSFIQILSSYKFSYRYLAESAIFYMRTKIYIYRSDFTKWNIKKNWRKRIKRKKMFFSLLEIQFERYFKNSTFYVGLIRHALTRRAYNKSVIHTYDLIGLKYFRRFLHRFGIQLIATSGKPYI